MPLSASILAAAIYAGIQGLLLTGVHTDAAGAQRGFAPGALLQIGVQSGRLNLRIEGIPPVGLPQKPSAFYGAATPQLSLFNGAIRYAINSNFQAGLGETIINQKTPLPNLDQVVASRLAGLRYEIRYRAPLANRHFVELIAGGAPHLTGADHYFYSIPQAGIDEPEVAAEEDVQLAWGVTVRDSEFLFGARTINFSARFVQTGLAADRNNGGGLMFEWRRFLAR